jgi:hypothetical protein
VPIYDGLLTRMSGAYLVANGEYLGDPSTRSYYSKVGPSPVIKDGSVYRMWPEMVSLPPVSGGPTSYSGQTGSFDSDTVTGYMTSSDGTTWTWYDTNSDGEPNRVIHPNCATNPAGGSTAWMRGEASVGTVLYDSTAGRLESLGARGEQHGTAGHVVRDGERARGAVDVPEQRPAHPPARHGRGQFRDGVHCRCAGHSSECHVVCHALRRAQGHGRPAAGGLGHVERRGDVDEEQQHRARLRVWREWRLGRRSDLPRGVGLRRHHVPPLVCGLPAGEHHAGHGARLRLQHQRHDVDARGE